MAAQVPTAPSRFPGSGKRFTMMVSVARKIRAAPMPIIARQKIKVAASRDCPAIAENTANKTNPTSSARLRQKRSPRLPAAMSSPANTRM